MVYFFTCQSDPTCIIYMGKDKFENESLIKYAYAHDVWFHVDNLSSAHVYLRTAEPITSYEQLNPDAIQECAQLTMANSIEGCKKSSVGINYTWATNLLKTGDMETGQVSYKNNKLVVKFHIEKNKDLIRKTLKTRKEEFPNLEELQFNYNREQQKKASAAIRAEKAIKEEEEKQKKDEIKKKKDEWNEFFEQQEETDKHMAGGNNKFLEDDFM